MEEIEYLYTSAVFPIEILMAEIKLLAALN